MAAAKEGKVVQRQTDEIIVAACMQVQGIIHIALPLHKRPCPLLILLPYRNILCSEIKEVNWSIAVYGCTESRKQK